MATQLLRLRSQLRLAINRLMLSTSESARAPEGPPESAVDTTIRTPEAFCLALKAARERRGISLAKIAEATKVCPSHFAALERGDVRRWPKGLFRRAFFRGYIGMIGVPIAETMEEFARLFPDDTAAATPTAKPVAAASTLRLSFDTAWDGPKPPIRSRLLAAAIDAGAVLVLAAAASWLLGANAAMMAVFAAMSYFTLATVLLGDSPTACAMRWHRDRATVQRATGGEAQVTAPSRLSQAWQSCGEIITLAFGNAGEQTSEKPTPLREHRMWTRDARRVAPRHGPTRLRVRFKLP